MGIALQAGPCSLAGFGVFPRDGPHALQQLLFLVHEDVGALEHVVEAGIVSGPVFGKAARNDNAFGADVLDTA